MSQAQETSAPELAASRSPAQRSAELESICSEIAALLVGWGDGHFGDRQLAERMYGFLHPICEALETSPRPTSGPQSQGTKEP